MNDTDSSKPTAMTGTIMAAIGVPCNSSLVGVSVTNGDVCKEIVPRLLVNWLLVDNEICIVVFEVVEKEEEEDKGEEEVEEDMCDVIRAVLDSILINNNNINIHSHRSLMHMIELMMLHVRELNISLGSVP